MEVQRPSEQRGSARGVSRLRPANHADDRGSHRSLEESNASELPTFATPFAGKLLLEGGKLWLTDGTPEGTEVVSDFPDSTPARPRYVVAGDRAYFSWFEEETGQELWALRP